jgi:hypothetical protein
MKNTVKQVDSRFIRYIVLLCLLEEGIINKPTFDNVVEHKYKEFKGKVF